MGFQRTAPIDQVQLVVSAFQAGVGGGGGGAAARPTATNSAFGFAEDPKADEAQPGSESLKRKRDSIEARRHVWGRHRTPTMQDAIAKTANIGWTTL